MVAALLKILQSGIQDVRLLAPKGQPKIDFFKKVFIKAGRFTTQWSRIDFDQIPDFGKSATITLPRQGHLISRIYLIVNLPDIVGAQLAAQAAATAAGQTLLGPTFGWTNSLGHVLVSSVANDQAQGASSNPQADNKPTQSPEHSLGISAGALLALLCLAGVACCIAMAMPQVHIVAYCTDLGFGAVKGAQMLSVMLAAGVVSRLIFGLISDRIGGLRTLLLGSVLQGLALLLFIPFQDLSSLFLVSALFGLFQGGIVPAYAIIVREYFPPQVAATRVGIVIMFTLGGMALGGWMSGWIFDVSGSYEAAFMNGIAWNLVNLLIVVGLLYRQRQMKQRFLTANHAA